LNNINNLAMPENFFVIKSVVPDVLISEIFKGIVPFWLATFLCITILIAVPSIALMSSMQCSDQRI